MLHLDQSRELICEPEMGLLTEQGCGTSEFKHEAIMIDIAFAFCRE